MSNEEGLKLPVEIPWQLAATTQSLSAGEPDETAISMFYFMPKDDELAGHYPDERLVYLKLVVSVSPAAFPENTPPAAALGEGVPCFHLRLDMKVRLTNDETNTIRPYFHAAAPLRREMLQTGIVGDDTFEGESSAQFIGKSGSQLHENLSSLSRTTSSSASAGFLGIGVSTRTSNTDVSSQRTVEQVIDTTARQASQERRELLSHITRVENILTLLSAKYVGTPHLSFSMSPRPLSLLSVDPSDPNLWFSQLLARRSSGIEGIQEFTVLLLVPRRQGFCVEAQIRRVCVLDSPPGPLTMDERFDINKPEHVVRMSNYLERVYPIGTPLEELDVNLNQLLKPSPDVFIRPVIFAWGFMQPFVFANVVSPPKELQVGVPLPQQIPVDNVFYKHMVEVWRDVLIDEYEREIARSPVERGVFLGESRTLDTCFAFAEGGGLKVSESNTSVSPLEILDINPSDVDLGGVSTTAGSITSTARERAYEAVTRWNLLDSRLVTLLANGTQPKRPFRLDDARVLSVMLRRWAKLAPMDPRNLNLDAARNTLGLTDTQLKSLKDAGISDMRDLASALLYGSGVDQYNQRVEDARGEFKAAGREGVLPESIATRLASGNLDALRQQVGVGLQATFVSGQTRES